MKLPFLIGLLMLTVLTLTASYAQKAPATFTNPLHQSDKMQINRLSERVYQHISYLSTNDYGKVACNGMVVVDDGEAIVLNAPTDDAGSAELIEWIRQDLKCTIMAVLPGHFHADGLGGLAEFHRQNIPSYANQRTIELANAQNLPLPQNGFTESLRLKVGRKTIQAAFVGEGHTRDNIVVYFPAEKAMFGGCMIKEVNATKGFLGDANLQEWSATVAKVKAKYPRVQIVVPGHGKVGGQELLDYTIGLFKPE
mgnify:CR=1 FL=1